LFEAGRFLPPAGLLPIVPSPRRFSECGENASLFVGTTGCLLAQPGDFLFRVSIGLLIAQTSQVAHFCFLGLFDVFKGTLSYILL
jgi:hypothetical protein